MHFELLLVIHNGEKSLPAFQLHFAHHQWRHVQTNLLQICLQSIVKFLLMRVHHRVSRVSSSQDFILFFLAALIPLDCLTLHHLSVSVPVC